MRATDFVQSYFDAWNHRDPIAVAGHLASDGIYCDMTENVRRSRNELVVSLHSFFKQYRHRYELIGDLAQSADTIAFQYCMCPLVKGRKPTSAKVIRGAEFITLHGASAATIHDYYDLSGTTSAAVPTQPEAGRTAAGKYAKSGLSEEQLHACKQALGRLMADRRAYLRSDLTLPALAQLMNCSVNHLSQVINAGFGMGYFDYVNRFRVHDAKALLAETAGKKSAVPEVALRVGFKSNAAFCKAFKKSTGQTPAQYQRACLNSSR